MGCDSQFDFLYEARWAREREEAQQKGKDLQMWDDRGYAQRSDGLVHKACGALVGDADQHDAFCMPILVEAGRHRK